MPTENVNRITGLTLRERLKQISASLPKLVEGTAFTEKMWIDPDGNVIPQQGFHFQYFRDPAVAAKWNVAYDPNSEQETRLSALKAGFTRINYERRSGTFTAEASRGWCRATKDIIFMLIADNASAIDNIRITVLNDEGQTVRTGTAQVFRYDDREKLNHIPLISESEAGVELTRAFLGS